jgi:D-tagatose-1,6-bisphosphate aldolase subunit GatZ/KbaZ
MKTMIAENNDILKILKKHKLGTSIGISSVCSANYYVLKAAILNAKKNNQIVLIESTSNQVDQYGGYTGLTPIQFKHCLMDLADSLDFPQECIMLGGDHLGPNRWQNEPSSSAIQKATVQISSYVSAGFSKIHLDASMKCADDGDQNNPLDPSIIAERSAILCKASEEVVSGLGKEIPHPLYVIGTDVPPPGGAKENQNGVHITSLEQVEDTIRLTEKAFKKYNLDDAWERVVGVVVQPGVEFGDDMVVDYDRNKSHGLVKLIEYYSGLVYEAHSTDYQKKELLRQMVEDHFALLKVGPWLTFKVREAAFNLALIEQELLSHNKGVILSNLLQVVDKRMVDCPKYWEKYYQSSELENRFKRKYSYSDRIRYYWSDKKVNESFNRLIQNLEEHSIPLTLLSQYFPEEYYAVREGTICGDPEEIIIHKISGVLDIYNYAISGGLI